MLRIVDFLSLMISYFNVGLLLNVFLDFVPLELSFCKGF